MQNPFLRTLRRHLSRMYQHRLTDGFPEPISRCRTDVRESAHSASFLHSEALRCPCRSNRHCREQGHTSMPDFTKSSLRDATSACTVIQTAVFRNWCQRLQRLNLLDIVFGLDRLNLVSATLRFWMQWRRTQTYVGSCICLSSQDRAAYSV